MNASKPEPDESPREVGVVLGTVECFDCGETHEASYSHEGRYGEGAVYAVVCGEYIEHYTTEAVDFGKPANKPAPVVEPATVDIAEVEPDTTEVEVAELVPGDVVFSVYGDASTLRRVRVLKDRSATVTHEDGRREWLAAGPIRVRRSGNVEARMTGVGRRLAAPRRNETQAEKRERINASQRRFVERHSRELGRHDYEPGDDTPRMRTDPSCAVCGQAKRSPWHVGE